MAEPAAREVGPEPEPHLRDAVPQREHEEPGELAGSVDGEVPPPPLSGVEQLAEVVGILLPVVERVDARVGPVEPARRGLELAPLAALEVRAGPRNRRRRNELGQQFGSPGR